MRCLTRYKGEFIYDYTFIKSEVKLEFTFVLVTPSFLHLCTVFSSPLHRLFFTFAPSFLHLSAPHKRKNIIILHIDTSKFFSPTIFLTSCLQPFLQTINKHRLFFTFTVSNFLTNTFRNLFRVKAAP